MYQKKGFPERGSLIVGTVKKQSGHAVTLSLDEFEGRDAELYTSEIERKWLRKLKSKLKPGTKVVCQVLKVNPKENVIALSQRNVSDGQNRKKLQEWANEKAADSVLNFFAKENKLPKAYEDIRDKLLESYGTLYPVFVQVAGGDEKLLEDAKIEKKLATKFYDFIKERLTPPKKKIIAEISMSSLASDGIVHIKEAFKKIKSLAPKNIDVRATYLGSPKYRLELVGEDLKAMDNIFGKMETEAEKYISKHDGEVKFVRQNVRYKKEK